MAEDLTIEYPLLALRLVREKECAKLTGLTRQKRYNLEREGGFPHRVPILPGSRHHGWPAGKIEDWLKRRVEEGDALAAEKSEGAEKLCCRVKAHPVQVVAR